MAAQLSLDEEYRVVSAMLDAMEGTGLCFTLTSGHQPHVHPHRWRLG